MTIHGRGRASRQEHLADLEAGWGTADYAARTWETRPALRPCSPRQMCAGPRVIERLTRCASPSDIDRVREDYRTLLEVGRVENRSLMSTGRPNEPEVDAWFSTLCEHAIADGLSVCTRFEGLAGNEFSCPAVELVRPNGDRYSWFVPRERGPSPRSRFGRRKTARRFRWTPEGWLNADTIPEPPPLRWVSREEYLRVVLPSIEEDWGATLQAARERLAKAPT